MAKYRRSIVIGLIVLLAVGVGEFWLYAAHRLGDYVHQPILGTASLADLCETSEIGGFPFRLKLSCHNLTAPLRAGDSLYYAGVEDAQGVASLFSPNHIVLTFSSPMVIQAARGAPVGKLRHDGMSLDIGWGLAGVARARLETKALDWRPEAAGAGVAVNVQKLAVSIAPQSIPEGAALHFELAGEGVTVPALQSLLQNNDPGRLRLAGAMTPPPASGEDWRAAAEDWRAKSGVLAIQRLEWQAGDLSLRLDGALSLDEAHRPAGRLNFVAQGAGALLARLGLPASAAQAGNVLGALLGKPSSQTDDNLNLPLNLSGGRIFIGPFKLPVALNPLY
ncbi:MAG TPA: DUF2125 domain-containing protein [Rhodoblastus sp.]|nr:DUF2125 domain-containing protein [Rhodoblastus sp.]